MYKFPPIWKLDNFERLHIQLVPIIMLGFIVFFSLITFVIEYNCNHCNNNFGYGSYAFGLSKPESNFGPQILDPNFKAHVYFKGIKFPSSMAFLGDNDILVLEKNDGTVRRIVNGVMLAEPLLKVNVSTVGERGMLGITILKRDNESKSPYIFLYYTAVTSKSNPFGDKAGDNSTQITNRLVRYELSNDRLVNGKLIFEVEPKGIVHNGGKMVVGPDNNVYLVIGDTAGGGNPQMDAFPNGRAGILRFTAEGDSVKKESGKSIMGNTYPMNKYYAYGLRNSFGMDFDPVSGKLWDTENGPNFGDEINLVEPGFNSGWENIQGLWKKDPNSGHVVLNPNPKDLASFGGRLTYSHPELAIRPEIGFTALTFIKSINYGKQYENDILVGDFHYGNLYDFDLNKNRSAIELNGTLDGKIVNNTSDLKSVILGRGLGGITDIKIGPDGSIYLLAVYQGGDNCSLKVVAGCITYSSSLPGTIFKIVPANSSLIEKEKK